jgi:O-antigen ligase
MAAMLTVRAKALEWQKLEQLADWLAVGVAVSLPWSTSATGILVALWLVAMLPTLNIAAVRRELATAAGGLPVLLWALGALGMLWADVSWQERLDGLGGFNKLLVIPLLLVQFRQSEHGVRVFYGFFASAAAVLLVSWTLKLFPDLPWQGKGFGIPVKDYIIQSTEFMICAFALLDPALQKARAGRWGLAIGPAAIACCFLANILFVVTGRTELLVIPVLTLLLGWRQFGWKGLVGAGLLGCIIGAAVWVTSPYLRYRMDLSFQEFQSYVSTPDGMSSTAIHLEFLKKSVSFVGTAPVIGHGTGSILEQFRNAAVDKTGVAAIASVNPHNQILAVAIQIGLVGVAALAAMWIAHLLLFTGAGMAAWIGLIVVVQNVVSSLFNSHLFDFTEGWLYVFGVGVAGGMILRERQSQRAAEPLATS